MPIAYGGRRRRVPSNKSSRQGSPNLLTPAQRQLDIEEVVILINSVPVASEYQVDLVMEVVILLELVPVYQVDLVMEVVILME